MLCRNFSRAPAVRNFLRPGVLRAYSNNSPPLEEPNETDIFAAAITGPAETASFPTWYKEMRSKLSVGTGPVCLGRNNAPFPYNPDFKPLAPVTDSFREKLVALWRTNPEEWTPRKLSDKFKISIERVKAIIKLKLVQKKMEEEGFKVNRKYVERMEQHLGATTPTQAEALPILDDVTQNMPPRLVAIPEESQLSAEEAARLLGRKLRPIHQLLSEDFFGDKPYDPTAKQEETIDRAALTIRNDPYEKARWKFVFVDTSATAIPAARRVLIREPNGDLRDAAPHERIAEGKKVWGERFAKHVA